MLVFYFFSRLRFASISPQRTRASFPHMPTLAPPTATVILDCGLPLCCRPPDGPAPAHNVTAGYFGDYNCDTSPALLHLMLETAAQLDPDLIFLTGDDPPHNVWR